MKIPLDDGPNVRSRPIATPYSNLNFDTGGAAVRQGLDQLGAGLEHGDLAYEQEKHRADTVLANNLAAEATDRFTKEFHGDSTGAPDPLGDPTNPEQSKQSPTGFLSTRGMEAHAKSADTMSRLERTVEDLAGKAKNDTQRQMFLSTAKTLLSGARGQIEGHVAQQTKVAEQDSMKARTSATLTYAANNYDQPELVDQALEQLSLPNQNLATSPEDAVATMNVIRGAAAKLRGERYLGANNPDGAQAVLEQARPYLVGQEAVQLQTAINEKRKGLGQDIKKAAAERRASDIVKSTAAPDTYPDEGKAYEALKGVPDEERDLVRTQLGEQIRLEKARKAADIDKWENDAQAVFNQGGYGAIPSEWIARLNGYDSKFVSRLMAEEHSRTREKSTDDAAERRDQAARNKVALDDFMARPAAERAELNVQKEYLGHGLDAVGLGSISVRQRAAKDAVSRGQSVSETEFLTKARAAVEGSFHDKEDPKAFDAEAHSAFEEMLRENKAAPNQKQTDEAVRVLVRHRADDSAEWRARAKERQGALKKGEPYFPPRTLGPKFYAPAPAAHSTPPRPAGARRGPDGRWYTRGPDGTAVPVQ